MGSPYPVVDILLGLGSWHLEGFLGGSTVKNPPAVQETRVQTLGQEDSLEEGMETHSSILSWRIP